MPNLDELSLKEVMDLILNFYIDPCGYLENEVDSHPEIIEFIAEGYAVLKEERYKLSEAGEDFLHKYIKTISEKFIQYIRERDTDEGSDKNEEIEQENSEESDIVDKTTV